MDRRQEIQRESGKSGEKNAILDRLEDEVERVVGELLRSREEAARLKARLEECEARSEEEGSVELVVLRKENRELRARMERIAAKAREMLKRLDVIEGG